MKNKMFNEIVNDFLINCIKFINSNIKTIYLLILLFFNLFMITIKNKVNTYSWMGIEIVFILFLILIFKYDDEVKKREVKKQIHFPHLTERLTKKLDEQIYIKEEDWSKAVLYLNEVEDFLQNVGLLKK